MMHGQKNINLADKSASDVKQFKISYLLTLI